MGITFSANAVSRGKEIVAEKGTPWLRLGIRGGGCSGLSYVLDFVAEPETKDKQMEFDGLQVCVDRKSYLYLVGTEVDFEDTLVRSGFVFHNPAAKRTCSCGESFAL